MHGIVNFLIVLLHSLLICFCTVLLSEVNIIPCHAKICRSIGQPSSMRSELLGEVLKNKDRKAVETSGL